MRCCVIEMADKPVCFAMRVGVVKGDRSRNMFRGSKASLGREADRFLWPGAKPLSAVSQIVIHTIYKPLSL